MRDLVRGDMFRLRALRQYEEGRRATDQEVEAAKAEYEGRVNRQTLEALSRPLDEPTPHVDQDMGERYRTLYMLRGVEVEAIRRDERRRAYNPMTDGELEAYLNRDSICAAIPFGLPAMKSRLEQDQALYDTVMSRLKALTAKGDGR